MMVSMSGWRRRLAERMDARGRANWGAVFTGPDLDEHMARARQFASRAFAFIGATIGVLVLVVAVDILVGVPPMLRLGAIVAISVPLAVRMLLGYRAVQVGAGRALGLTPREARKLDVSNVQALRRSLGRLRSGA